MEDKITKAKIDKYMNVSSKALGKAKVAIARGREKDAEEIITMVEAYLSDAKHFLSKGDLVNSFGCLNYAHGWLDSGARLGVFEVKDNKLFTV